MQESIFLVEEVPHGLAGIPFGGGDLLGANVLCGGFLLTSPYPSMEEGALFSFG